MILFVDNEHETGYAKPWGEKIMAARVWIKYRLEDISGEPCLLLRYNHVTPQLLHELNIRAVLISGNSANPTDYAEEDVAGLRAVLWEKSWPVFGFCGGFETIAETFGAEVAPIGPVSPDQPEPKDEVIMVPGMKQEFGYMPINFVESHPFLEGLNGTPVFREAHTWEAKSIPAGFKCYAETETSPIQVIIHETLPMIGTQFHPEYYTDEHPAGKVMIENFFKVAGIGS